MKDTTKTEENQKNDMIISESSHSMDIRKLRGKQEKFYKSIVSVHCPVLKETIYFTSEGFSHLIYHSNRKPRNINEQYMKLLCLTHAPKVIKKCTNIPKTRQVKKKIKGKMKSGVYIALVCEVSKGVAVRVVIEKIGTGKHRFISVMYNDNKSKKASKLKNTPKGAH